MTAHEIKARADRWLRFVFGGGINTAATYTVYLLLNSWLSYQSAYLAAYIVGIVFSYVFNSLVVFRASLSWRGLLAYPLVYVVQYGVSAILLGLLVESGLLGETMAPLLVVAVTIPLTYALSKKVINRSQRP